MTPQEVKALRKRLGLKQEDMARALGVTVFTLCRWETGYNAPSPLGVLALKALAQNGNKSRTRKRAS